MYEITKVKILTLQLPLNTSKFFILLLKIYFNIFLNSWLATFDWKGTVKVNLTKQNLFFSLLKKFPITDRSQVKSILQKCLKGQTGTHLGMIIPN